LSTLYGLFNASPMGSEDIKGMNNIHRQTERYSSAGKVDKFSESLSSLCDGKEWRNGRQTQSS